MKEDTEKSSNGKEEKSDDEEELSEVDQLRLQLAQLHQFCVETREELLTHRQVLEQCLEMREGVEEILEHRETFKQCIAMEDSIKAVVGGAKIMGEVGERQLELDLSLAGVSDNTARHGKAISTLAEQQKRTGSTLDAVVRAVKRLGRSRSRGRGEPLTLPFDQAMGGTDPLDDGDGGRLFSTGSAAAPTLAYMPPILQDGLLDRRAKGARSGAGSGDRKEADDLGPTAQPNEWLDGHLEESQPRLLPDGPLEDHWQGLVQELTGRYGGPADDADWIGAPGWPPLGTAGLEADVLESLHGFYGAGATSEDEPRYISGSSSCGSETRASRAVGSLNQVCGSSRSGTRTGTGGGGGIPDPCLGGPGDPGKVRRGGGPASNAPIASPEMQNCVQGVLDRINEALIKLDGKEADGAGSGRPRTDQGRRPRPSNGAAGDTGHHGRRAAQRPNSARGTTSSRGGNGTPRATTPRGR